MIVFAVRSCFDWTDGEIEYGMYLKKDSALKRLEEVAHISLVKPEKINTRSGNIAYRSGNQVYFIDELDIIED